MSFHDGRARCDQDSDDASVSGFLHMPMPRSRAENQIYFDLIKDKPDNIWLDITEVNDITGASFNPREWELKGGSPATWFSWNAGEPNNWNREPYVQMLRDHGTGSEYDMGNWNDIGGDGNYQHNVVCSYFLLAGAKNNCPWISDFQN